MIDTLRPRELRWTRERAALVAILCLAAGIAGGWLLRGLRSSPVTAAEPHASTFAASQASPATTQASDAGRLKEAVDAQAAPLMQQLKSDPQNVDLLIGLGNLYYDAKQYSAAVDYYGRALQISPGNAAVRTDCGTAYWYMGNADRALSEFDKALHAVPDNPNTLFNRGLVRWQGKHDSAGALADWKQLLTKDPNYQEKDKIRQMMQEIAEQTSKR